MPIVDWSKVPTSRRWNENWRLKPNQGGKVERLRTLYVVTSEDLSEEKTVLAEKLYKAGYVALSSESVELDRTRMALSCDGIAICKAGSEVYASPEVISAALCGMEIKSLEEWLEDEH